MDALALLASLGLTETEQVYAEKAQAELVLTDAELRISEAQAKLVQASSELQAAAYALKQAEALGVKLALDTSKDKLVGAKRSLVKALQWADAKDYRPRAIIAAERNGTAAGKQAKEEIRQQVRFLWKLYNRAVENWDAGKQASLAKELDALYRGRKLKAVTAGAIKARSGRKCPYSVEGKSTREYKLVIEQACRVTAVTRGAKLSLPAGKAPAKYQGEQDSLLRLDAMGERVKAAKRRVRSGKL